MADRASHGGERYPGLTKQKLNKDKTLPFEITTKPKYAHKGGGRKEVKTFLAADIDAFVAADRAKKRPRLGRPPRAGEPEPEPEEEEEESEDDDECITYARVSEWV